MAGGVMEVTVVGARGLKDVDFLGKIDPYVVVQYRGQERKTSIARGQGSKPVWNEKLRFRAEYPGKGDDHQYKLELNIMDHDNFSSDDYLGHATIYLKEILEMGVENGKAEIHPRKYSIVSSNQSFNGEIQVGIVFTLREENYEGEEYGGWKESED